MGADSTTNPARRGASPRGRAVAFTAAVAVLAVGLFLNRTVPGADGIGVAMLVVAVAFSLADIAVVHVHLRRETFSFSLSELVLVGAIVYAAPVDVVVGQVLGLAVTLAFHRRQPLLKLTFNLAQASVASHIALLVAQEAAYGAAPLSARGLAAVLLGVVAASLVSGFLVQGVISMMAGRASWKSAPTVLLFNAIAGLGAGCLALQAVALIEISRWGMVPVAISSAVVFAAYRGYAGERQRSQQVEVIHDTGRVFQQQPLLEPAVLEYLDRLRSTFNCEHAALLSIESTGPAITAVGPADRWSPTAAVGRTPGLDLPSLVADERAARLLTEGSALDRWIRTERDMADGILAPLHTAAVNAVLVVGGRLGDVGAHTPSDIRLLSLLADQLAVILDNRRLDHAATHDALTGLANRRLFDDRLRTATDGAPGQHALLLLDLDGLRGCSSEAEHQLPKLRTRVRFPSPALHFIRSHTRLERDRQPRPDHRVLDRIDRHDHRSTLHRDRLSEMGLARSGKPTQHHQHSTSLSAGADTSMRWSGDRAMGVLQQLAHGLLRRHLQVHEHRRVAVEVGDGEHALRRVLQQRFFVLEIDHPYREDVSLGDGVGAEALDVRLGERSLPCEAALPHHPGAIAPSTGF
jgi:hypothetical protein